MLSHREIYLDDCAAVCVLRSTWWSWRAVRNRTNDFPQPETKEQFQFLNTQCGTIVWLFWASISWYIDNFADVIRWQHCYIGWYQHASTIHQSEHCLYKR